MDSQAAPQKIDPPPVLARGRPVRVLYTATGALFVVMGIAGIVLPLLPSTPFFLLAAGCFGKSSPRAYRWLLTNRYFGAQLRVYREHRGATVRSKTIAIATIWAGISLSVFVFQPPLLIDALLVAIAVSVSIYLLRLRSISPETAPVAGDRGSWG